MASYTPLFDSLTKGTLCGKWPDIGLWPLVLSMADRYGVVDVTHQYIATVSGLELGEVVACMDRFCQPDPLSRSQDNDGRRLVCLEQHRSWGWRIVNHGKYAEKARLIHKNARDVESGKAAERKRAERAASADVPRCPPASPSQAQAQAQAQKKKKTGAYAPRPSVSEVAEYISSRGSKVDPQQFVDFYESNGWKVGKNPMKDWRAAVRTWEQRNETDQRGMARNGRGETVDDKLRRLRGDGKPRVGEPDGGVRGSVLPGVWGRT